MNAYCTKCGKQLPTPQHGMMWHRFLEWLGIDPFRKWEYQRGWVHKPCNSHVEWR